MKSRVALVRCESYDYAKVKEAVKKGLDLLGGAEQFVKKDEKVLLKVNLLVGDHAEKSVTTHPSVFRAVAEYMQSAAAKVVFGDSPSIGSLQAAAKKAGMLDIANNLGVELADFTNGKDIFFEKGVQNKKFFVAEGILHADAVISLPKLKTHALERFTGCIKNQFGCIVGMRKGEFHVKLSDAHEFGKMLVDLNNFIKPRLYVMDGIVAMEGNGPRGGKPRAMNVLLFSTDPVALDATACRLINLDPTFVPTNVYGMESGAGTYLENEIDLLGDPISSFISIDFDVVRKPIKSAKKNSILSFMNNRLVAKPFIRQEKCTKCGTCVNSCPVEGKAVNWFDGDKHKVPQYNYDKCIRCYCCQEVCPEGAIELQAPLMRRVIKTIAG